jgi:hypothetical protein
MRNRILVCCWLLQAGLQAQTQIDLRTQSKTVDFSAAASTQPAKKGTTLPATCVAGEQFFKTDAAAGQNLYLCASTNTWTQSGQIPATVAATNQSNTYTAGTQDFSAAAHTLPALKGNHVRQAGNVRDRRAVLRHRRRGGPEFVLLHRGEHVDAAGEFELFDLRYGACAADESEYHGRRRLADEQDHQHFGGQRAEQPAGSGDGHDWRWQRGWGAAALRGRGQRHDVLQLAGSGFAIYDAARENSCSRSDCRASNAVQRTG